jgi:hypothetical protein
MTAVEHWENASHVAYCTGPAQLTYLMSALREAGVSRDAVLIMPYKGGAANDELEDVLGKLARLLGFDFVNPNSIRTSGLRHVMIRAGLQAPQKRTIFWFSRGISFSPVILKHLWKTDAAKLAEYFDGFRSFIVLDGSPRRRIRSATVVGLLRNLRSLMLCRLIEPEWRFLLSDPQWTKVAFESPEKNRWFGLDTLEQSIVEVGTCLEQLGRGGQEIPGKSRFVLLCGMFSERVASVSLERELGMYDEILNAVASASPGLQLVVKSHPRSSTVKMAALQGLGRAHGALVITAQQLIEYLLIRAEAGATVALAPPSTSLLHLERLGLATPMCLGVEFLCQYFGRSYRHQDFVREDHAVMGWAGITKLDSLLQLVTKVRALPAG